MDWPVPPMVKKSWASRFPGPIYTSANSGATWTKTKATNQEWYAVASSADGKRLVAAGGNIIPYTTYTRYIYLSTNSGASWQLSPLFGSEWESLASSADGLHLIAADYSGLGSVYTSADGGNTWVSNSVSAISLGHSWSAVAMSADGKKMAAGDWDEGPAALYTSTDSGLIWQSNNAPLVAWESLAMSADGNRITGVVGYGGGIYSVQNPTSPALQLVRTNKNCVLSWLVPSTNLVLKRTFDLSTNGWTLITNAPVLNLTNLIEQVTLTATNPRVFYQLAAP